MVPSSQSGTTRRGHLSSLSYDHPTGSAESSTATTLVSYLPPLPIPDSLLPYSPVFQKHSLKKPSACNSPSQSVSKGINLTFKNCVPTTDPVPKSVLVMIEE
jgi:hypothetical protein